MTTHISSDRLLYIELMLCVTDPQQTLSPIANLSGVPLALLDSNTKWCQLVLACHSLPSLMIAHAAAILAGQIASCGVLKQERISTNFCLNLWDISEKPEIAGRLFCS